MRCAHKHMSKIILSNIDVLICLEPKNALLLACSAYTNGKNLLACESSESPNAIPCLDGIRAIAAPLVLAFHFGFYMPEISGNTNYIEIYSGKFRQLFNGGNVCVDTFFVMSAFLAAKKMLNEYSKLVSDFENVSILLTNAKI